MELILTEGSAVLAERGYAAFSTRELAKRIGYSIGTIYNVFGTHDRLILAINTRTFRLWADHLRARLDRSGGDRIRTLVEGYFSFARENPNLWMAIYDHRLPPDVTMPAEYEAERAELTEIVTREIGAILAGSGRGDAARLARSLIATVHGHCTFALNGTFALMGETDPLELALARVRESLSPATH